jgi:hypothetical protein
MFDLMAIAFQSDITRVSTMLLAHDGSNRPFRELGITSGHHDLSHHKLEEDKIKSLEKIDHFYIQQFAYFLEKLKAMPDMDGRPLLDNCMIVCGGGISDGNRHRHTDLPVILAGGGGGALTPGRHVHHGNQPMTNLYISLLQNMGVTVDRVGDSTAPLTNI